MEKIAVFGSTGLVGSNIIKKLDSSKYDILCPPRKDLDLMDLYEVLNWFSRNNPDKVILSAARVGGIIANSSLPTQFIYQNLTIQNNVIASAFEHGVNDLIFLGSSCIYPRECPQPIKEEYLLSGPLEKTNQSYAVAKIAGVQFCNSIREQYGKNYYSVMPCNLYGPGDNFNPEASHVIPGMIMKFYDAIQNGSESVKLLGTGNPLREFLYIEDLAEAVVFLLENYTGEHELINIGSGKEISIRNLAIIIADALGYRGEIVFNTDGPDGTPRKIMDNSRINSLGWEPKVSLEEGIKETVKWFYDNIEKIRK